MPASWRLAAGNRRALALCRAATAIGSSPRIGGMRPSSDSPPTMVTRRVFAVGQHARGRQNPERDGQIERRADLAQVGRPQADRHAARRKRKARVANRGPHAIAALADRRVGQTDHRHDRQPGCTRRLPPRRERHRSPNTAAADTRASMSDDVSSKRHASAEVSRVSGWHRGRLKILRRGGLGSLRQNLRTTMPREVSTRAISADIR